MQFRYSPEFAALPANIPRIALTHTSAGRDEADEADDTKETAAPKTAAAVSTAAVAVAAEAAAGECRLDERIGKKWMFDEEGWRHGRTGLKRRGGLAKAVGSGVFAAAAVLLPVLLARGLRTARRRTAVVRVLSAISVKIVALLSDGASPVKPGTIIQQASVSVLYELVC